MSQHKALLRTSGATLWPFSIITNDHFQCTSLSQLYLLQNNIFLISRVSLVLSQLPLSTHPLPRPTPQSLSLSLPGLRWRASAPLSLLTRRMDVKCFWARTPYLLRLLLPNLLRWTFVSLREMLGTLWVKLALFLCGVCLTCVYVVVLVRARSARAV